MKTKQKPTGAAGVAATATARVQTHLNPRHKEDEAIRLRQRQAPAQCERERKHEAARKEKEAQAQAQTQLKKEAAARRSTAKPTLTTTATSTLTQRRPIKDSTKESKQPKVAASAEKASSGSGANDEETAMLQLQLEHLAQLSEQDFEREFGKWMSQEGIESKMHAQLRTELINSFNSTSLGQLLGKASASAAELTEQQHCLLLSPLALMLHTLVGEFLYTQNCHYTLSVFCSEMQHRHALPDFEGRAEFRFSQEELQQVLSAVLGVEQAEELTIGQAALRIYDQPEQSLLLALLKALVDERRPDLALVSVGTMTHAGDAREMKTMSTQTQPASCLQSQPDVDTSQPYHVEELIVADDEHTVFIGPRVSQSLYGVEQQLGQLMRYMGDLCKSCAPPMEVISQKAFQQLLQQEILERQRLLDAGEKLPPGQAVIKLPECTQHHEEQEQEEPETVLSPNGPIQLPKAEVSAPKMPHLHSEQLASLAMVQQSLQQLQQLQQQQEMQPVQNCMHVTLERIYVMVSELAGCVQTLSNVLNLSMEQEYGVGRNKGFKMGYMEGFSHGHFMGLQEGEKKAEQKQQLQPQPQHQLQHTSSQTQLESKRTMKTAATQTKPILQRHIFTNTEQQIKLSMKHAASQTMSTAGRARARSRTQAASSDRSYEQWIYEMLHSKSGLIFLERVELSLNKALELQKQRLDELYDIRLRHHAELIRLSRRQRSWRTLCRHVERDTHSKEARDLVQKIFCLLEHYEAHHQLLAEKLQQTELAAEQAARMEPVWNDAYATNWCTRTGSPQREPQPSPQSQPDPAPAPATALASAPASAPALVPSSTSNKPASYAQHLVTLAASSTAAPSTVKPDMQSTATNTIKLSHVLTDVRPKRAPSFNEALLSAKSRMMQLEQESNLLEQSFLGYLERARVQNQKLNIRTSCVRERQQVHRKPENFCEWQPCIRGKDVMESVQQSVAVVAPPVSPINNVSELEPESYPFTNAIAVARHKLLSELHVTAQPVATALAPVQQLDEMTALNNSESANQLLVDQMQQETQVLLNRMEATLARVSKPASLQLLTVESRLPMFDDALGIDPPSSVTPTSLTSNDLLDACGDIGGCGGGGAGGGSKLQRSMAKMQQLFGSQTESKSKPAAYVPLKQPATRPWSAPTSKLRTSCLPLRPHTAPSTRLDAAGAPASATLAPNLLGLLDALSDVGDTTGSSSSLGSSLDSHRNALYAQLVGNASSNSHASSSPPLSHSADFWKRMDL